MIYMKLDEPVTTVTAVTEQASANSEWDGVLEELFDEWQRIWLWHSKKRMLQSLMK